MRLKPFGLTVLITLVTGCGPNADTKVSSIRVEPTATVAFNIAGAPTVEFNAPDMMCPEGCGAKVKEILSEQPGAKEVVIDFEAKTATVAIEEGKFDPAAAVAALKDYGFDNSTLKSSDAIEAESDDVAEEPAS